MITELKLKIILLRHIPFKVLWYLTDAINFSDLFSIIPDYHLYINFLERIEHTFPSFENEAPIIMPKKLSKVGTLANNFKIPCLGISAGIKDIRVICQEKLSGNRYQAISHLSIGFRPDEILDNNHINTLLKEAQITTSLHPVDINLSDVVENNDLDSIKKLADQLEPVYFEEDLGLWRHHKLFLESHLLNPIMSKESMNLTVENVCKCSSFLSIPIAIENPPIYCAYGEIDFWDYFFYIAEQSGCLIAFDVGHFIGYCRSLDKKIYFPKKTVGNMG